MEYLESRLSDLELEDFFLGLTDSIGFAFAVTLFSFHLGFADWVAPAQLGVITGGCYVVKTSYEVVFS